LSSLPKLAGAIVDVHWDATQSGTSAAEISANGLQVDVDVAGITPPFPGPLSLHCKLDVPADVLTALPRRSLNFDMPPKNVLRAVGVTYRPSRLEVAPRPATSGTDGAMAAGAAPPRCRSSPRSNR